MLTASCLHEILKPCNEIAFQRDLDAALPHAWLQGSLGMWPCTVRVPVSESAGTSVAAWALDWSLGSLSHIVCVGATKAPAAFDQNILLVAVLAESSPKCRARGRADRETHACTGRYASVGHSGHSGHARSGHSVPATAVCYLRRVWTLRLCRL